MSLIKGIHHVALKCCGKEEFEKTKQFYGEVLGLPVARSWNSGIMYDPRVASAALAHWDTLISRYTADTPRTPYFDRLMLERTRQTHDYLVAHQDSRITLAELAAKFHLSQSSLKLCFKALYGVPVAGYLRTVRMDTAARLLRESDLPVAEIAHRVGYEDPSRFSAAFRRHTGRRPTELRRVACPCAE